MYYKGKKRRDSRYWWRRIRSRKYRGLLIKKSIQLAIVTAAICVLAILTGGRYDLYFLIWCLIVGVIFISLKQNLRDTESLEQPQEQRHSKSKLQDITTASQQTPEKSAYPIDEIPSKKTKTKSQKTS